MGGPTRFSASRTELVYAPPEAQPRPGRLVRCPQVAWINTAPMSFADQYGYELLTSISSPGATPHRSVFLYQIGRGSPSKWATNPDFSRTLLPSASPFTILPHVDYPFGAGGTIRSDPESIDQFLVIAPYRFQLLDAANEAKAIIEAARPGTTYVKIEDNQASGDQSGPQGLLTSGRQMAPMPDSPVSANGRPFLGTDFLYITAGLADYVHLFTSDAAKTFEQRIAVPGGTFDLMRARAPVPHRRSLIPPSRFAGYAVRYLDMTGLAGRLMCPRTYLSSETLTQGWWPFAAGNSRVMDYFDSFMQRHIALADEWAGMLREEIGLDVQPAGLPLEGVTGRALAELIAGYFGFPL